MSGFGGFGGFGQNNNQQSTGFGGGGFGTNTTANTGFGAPAATTSAFGASNTTGGGLFGGGTSTFGNSGGGFGNTQNNAFGAKPGGFGTATTTTGSSMFGGTATAGPTNSFGGFGGAANTSTGFGATNNTTGGLFGANKPAGTFGSPAAASPFGGGAATSTFGGTANTGFGAPPSTALGPNTTECQGTGSVAFQPTLEKEPNTTSNQQNAFQSISFMQPYQKFSHEELRLADYAQGRRFGNASNQAGAFGATNFGGFGATNAQPAAGGFGAAANTGTGSNLFGGAATSSPFGGTQQAATGFGAAANPTGGLFGAKPAATGFGAAATSSPFGAAQPATTGFGNNTTGGFGAANNTSTSLFGANNNAQKPAFGGFGNAQTTAGTGTGFGAAAPTTGGFGQAAGGLFGNAAAQQPATNAFGQAAQPATGTSFGGFGAAQPTQSSTTSLFGANNQAKPAGGLFGNTAPANNTLFGGTQPAAAPGGFGAANQTQNTGGLFGAKPATAGTGLFGAANNTTQPAAGTGLFGGLGQSQSQNNQQGTTSLFGGLNNNNQQKTGLFGQPQQQATTGLFGGAGNQQQTGLFGNTGNQQQQQQQQQPQNSLFGANSLFGGSQNTPTQQSLNTSISDSNAFGQSMFSNLGANSVSNPGPIATPLSSGVKQKKTAPLPMYKLSLSSTSTTTTPQKRGGFGFSYSNYGTPGSASSVGSTPGALSVSRLGASFGGPRLSKSMSTSSLHRSFNAEDGILSPGAFSTSPSFSHYGSTGNKKKLIINRSIRSDLFTPTSSVYSESQSTPIQGSILKKRVSFDTPINSNGTSAAQAQGGATPTPGELGFIRPRTSTNGAASKDTNNAVTSPEMEQVKGNELAIVPEENSASTTSAQPADVSQDDKEPGRYWMKPSKEEIENMNRAQRSKVSGLTVGRDGVGQVIFDTPVDLTNINLSDICETLVVLEVRSATVYPASVKKPPMGKGLNVPSIISLQNSWPRGRKTPTGILNPKVKKHIERLKKVDGTEFVDYEVNTGIWTFRVPHFTTYGLDYDDDDETDNDAPSEFDQSALSGPPDTPTPVFKSRTPSTNILENSFASTSGFTHTESDPDDTFQFRKKKVLPGAFDHSEIFEDDASMEEDYDVQPSFLDERSVGSRSEEDVAEPMDQDDMSQDHESISVEDQEMAGSFPQPDYTTEPEYDSHGEDDDDLIAIETPGAILRARMRASKNLGTPSKPKFVVDDWTKTLQTTISPQKQDRAALKTLIDLEEDGEAQPETGLSAPNLMARSRIVSDGRGFATSIDLMNSLFGQAKSPVKPRKAPVQGFQWPYAKRNKTNDFDMSNMTATDRSFHNSMKPSWGPDGTLVYAVPSNSKSFGRSSYRARERNGILTVQKGAVVSENRDVRFAKFSNESSVDPLRRHKKMALITIESAVPFARLTQGLPIADLFDDRNARDPAAIHEKLVWQLAGILFDELPIPSDLQNVPGIAERLRKDNLSTFWQQMVDQASTQQIAMARSNEEKAIASLSGNKIVDACAQLISGKDFRLATLVSLIGSKDSMRKDIREQLNEWQKSRVLSEFSQPVRALYEILAGNVCVCNGSKNAPIEDRIESFIISKRFGLDWRQAFGLRLWYATLSTDKIQQAVEKFAEDLDQDRETSRPQAWYVEHGISTLWDDKELTKREDLLWGLLKIYSSHEEDLEAILRPENSQLSPLDLRLSWQLSLALRNSGAATYRSDVDEKADQSTLSFAAQLTNEGHWLDALFVLLHLTSSESRAKAIQNHLARHAEHIGSDDTPSFSTLTKTLRIPLSWIWEAKALYLRSVKKDPKGEVNCLIKAGSFDEAHRTFAKDVAPRAVIECDYDILRSLLGSFKGKETLISDWQLGGGLYQDFLDLLDAQKKGRIEMPLLERLLTGLPAVLEGARSPAFMERVAIETISGIVARGVIDARRRGRDADLPRVLKLPLTEDKRLKHTIGLSMEYYTSVMAGGK